MLKRENRLKWFVITALVVGVFGGIIASNLLCEHQYVGHWQCWDEKDLVLQINEDYTCNLLSRDSFDDSHRNEDTIGVWSWWPPDWPKSQNTKLPDELQNSRGIALFLTRVNQSSVEVRATAYLTWNGKLALKMHLNTEQPRTFVFRKSK